jgi:hypothetical protein
MLAMAVDAAIVNAADPVDCAAWASIKASEIKPGDERLATQLWAICLNADEVPGWAERCRAQYKTFRESDGTVIRRVAPDERVRCPVK